MSGYFRSLLGHTPPVAARVRPLLSPYPLRPIPVDEAVMLDVEHTSPAAFDPVRSETKGEAARDSDQRTALVSPAPARKREPLDVPPPRPAVGEGRLAPTVLRSSVGERQRASETTVERPTRRTLTPATLDAPARRAPLEALQSRERPDGDSTRRATSWPVVGATRSRQTPPAARREQPPDVHIHIGRIELTASAAPSRPRRQPAPVKTAMPLAEYLQRRNRKEP